MALLGRDAWEPEGQNSGGGGRKRRVFVSTSGHGLTAVWMVCMGVGNTEMLVSDCAKSRFAWFEMPR